MSLATLRNVVIVLALAAVVAIAPGGGTAANVVLTAVSLAFLAALGWVASIMYRQHRGSLYLLGTRRRAIVYAAIAVLAVTITATHRMWSSNLWSVAWLALVGLSVYALFAVFWSARRY